MKKVLFSISLMLCIAALSGCSEKEAAPVSESGEVTASKETSEASAEEAEDETEDSEDELEMIVDWPGLMYLTMAASDEGCYEVMYGNPDGSANFLYTDIATRQRIYLSPDLSADHQSPSDPSYIDNSLGGCFVFTAGDALFLSRYNYEDTPGELYRMDLDGRNRRSLTKFTDYYAPTGGIASDGQYLYTILLSDDGNALVRINADTGELEVLKEVDGDACFLMSAYEHSLVIKMINQSDEEDPAKTYEDQKYIIYAYDLRNGAMEEITSWNQNEVIENYNKNQLYLIEKNSDCLKAVDLSGGEGGEEKMLIPSFTDAGINIDELSSVSQIWDHHMICNFIGENGEYTKKHIDLSSGEVKPLETYSDTLDAYSQQHLGIVGEFGDEFLVTSGTLEVPVDSFDPAGNPIVTDMIISKLSVIKKEDFWNNRFDAMEPVEDVFLESLN